MKNLLKSILVIAFLSISLFAKSGEDIANELGMQAGTKAIKQWERVFKKAKKMKKYGIDKLTDDDKNALKEYLTNHAADSDHPAAAGL